MHDDVIKWKHFPCCWPFVWGIPGWPVNSLHKGQWHAALMFSSICAWINGWVNHHEAGGWWLETPYCSLWHHCNANIMDYSDALWAVHIFKLNKVNCVYVSMGILYMHLHKFIMHIIVANCYANNLPKLSLPSVIKNSIMYTLVCYQWSVHGNWTKWRYIKVKIYIT